jgi:hypothetical protein
MIEISTTAALLQPTRGMAGRVIARNHNGGISGEQILIRCTFAYIFLSTILSKLDQVSPYPTSQLQFEPSPRTFPTLAVSCPYIRAVSSPCGPVWSAGLVRLNLSETRPDWTT